MSKTISWAVGVVAAIIVVAALVVYPKLVVTLPNDGADAKPNTFKDTYGHRYTTAISSRSTVFSTTDS